MDPAPFRITLWQAKRRPRCLTRLVAEGDLGGAVLCAQQWCVWSNDKGRGKRDKYDRYSVETRETDGTWSENVAGTLADARKGWTSDDEQRLEAGKMVRPYVAVMGTTRQSGTRSRGVAERPKTRLAQMIADMQARR